MQADYAPSGWLGLLTAGTLWTPMHDESSLEESVDGLVRQITLAVAPEQAEYGVSQDEAAESPDFSKNDLRYELDRLKTDQESESNSQVASFGEDGRAQAMVPAAAPELPLGVLVTQPMEELLSHLVDGESTRVGFLVRTHPILTD